MRDLLTWSLPLGRLFGVTIRVHILFPFVALGLILKVAFGGDKYAAGDWIIMSGIIGETLLEVPAGTLEPNEPPEAAAARELAEETGYRAGRWRKLAEFVPSPGVLSERTHLFLAQDLTSGRLQLEKDESLEPQLMTWQEAVARALDGTIRDAKTLIAILLWDRLRGREGW